MNRENLLYFWSNTTEIVGPTSKNEIQMNLACVLGTNHEI